MQIPIPHNCFDCRHKARMALRNPRRLWSRTCAKCGTAISTSYSPDRPEIVYCEECYLKEVY
jgi:CxxC-x17-CxxC domain-containing protein